MTGLSWLFYFKALHDGPLSVIAPIDKLSIALTIILAFIFLNEPMTLKTIAGGLMIIGGVIVLIL